MWKILRQIGRNGIRSEAPPDCDDAVRAEAERIQRELLAILGRALAIRAIDPGSCNGCELEINALDNPYYNLEGLGIRFVASPRHADLLLVTGPVWRSGTAAPAAASSAARTTRRAAELPRSFRSTSSSAAARRRRSRSCAGS
jgi:hypothetical protein